MDRRAEATDTRFMSFFYGIVAGLSALLVALLLVWILHFRNGFGWQDNPQLEFNWHPLLMVLSLIVLYGHGILTYRMLRNERKKKLKIIHAVVMISALVLASVGLKAVFDSHNLAATPIPNLYSLHSWIGLTTVIFFAMQWLFGFVSFLFPGLKQSLRAAYMPLHVFGGLLIYAMAAGAVVTGLLEKAIFTGTSYNPLRSEGIIINCIGLVVVSLVGLVMYVATRSHYKRQPLPEDELLLADKFEE